MNETEMNPSEYSPSSLAFIGDAYFELKVRTAILKQAQRPVKELNKLKVKLVSADAQAVYYDKLSAEDGILSAEELDIMKRGRNAFSKSTRGSSVGAYRKATGFEALMGYLSLLGDDERCDEIIAFLNIV
ncbi:MAG: Mini-ribonuclease 3 [Lachnospiraceae bacterium]|nr:Mini-ribonuclease 3 [Lachnospiraceae bacterium]